MRKATRKSGWSGFMDTCGSDNSRAVTRRTGDEQDGQQKQNMKE